MKTGILLIFSLAGNMCTAQFLNDSIVRAQGIYEIAATIKQKSTSSMEVYNQSIKWITLYNTKRLAVKVKAVTPNRDSYGFDSSISHYTYNDTLEIKAEWKEYINGKVSGWGEEQYDYTFDSLKRRLSKNTRDLNGKQTREIYYWNHFNLTDSIHFYTNDSVIYIPQRNATTSIKGKTLQLKKTVTNTWDSTGRLLKSEECIVGCKWLYSDATMCCSTTEFFKSDDTTIRKILTYYDGWHTTFDKEYHLSNGGIYESVEQGHVLTFYRKNEKNLTTRIYRYEVNPFQGRHHDTETSIQYKYRTPVKNKISMVPQVKSINFLIKKARLL